MANENKDVLRVRDAGANIDNGASSTIRQKQIGFGSDTHALYFRDTDDTIYKYVAEGEDYNDGKTDIDFVVNASGIDDAFFVDGATGRIGINHNAPVHAVDYTNETYSVSRNGFVESGFHASIINTGEGTGDFYLYGFYSNIIQDDGDGQYLVELGGAKFETELASGDCADIFGTQTTASVTGGELTTGDLHGHWISTRLTAGDTDEDNDIFGIKNNVSVDYNGGEVGDIYGIYSKALLEDGTVGGDGYIVHGAYIEAKQEGGEIIGDLIGVKIYAAASGGDLSDIYGVHIQTADSAGADGDVYGIYLYCNTGTDYGIYQVGNVKNVFAGAIGYIPDEITATSAGVAASLITTTTEVTTNGDSDLDNVTLANGYTGQIKHIYCVAELNAADTWKITPANMVGGTQITFSGEGEGCTLVYANNEGWIVIGNNGGTIS